MKNKNEPNGYITLKIELNPPKSVRTIVVPEHMTLTDLHCAIQAVMGRDNSHLWSFMDKKRDGVIYERPNPYGDADRFSNRLTVDASLVSLRNVLPCKGAKLYYEYDFGDSWCHTITRMADPKTPETACLKSEGPDGIEDFGGQWRLADFIQKMRSNPNSKAYKETREWIGLGSDNALKKYLDGDSPEEKTVKLRKALRHVKPAPKPQPPMSEEEQAHMLGLMFATLVDSETWKILEEALKNGGTCEFDDPDKNIGSFFLTMFEGLKVKDGRSNFFSTEPSQLTVHAEWVEMYKTHGEEWRMLHEQFDIVESYATSAANLYGAISIDELYELILRYDPGCKLTQEEVRRLLDARAAHCPSMPFFISGNIVVSNTFPLNKDDVNGDLVAFREKQLKTERWYPETRSDLFDWEDCYYHPASPESDRVRNLLKTSGIFRHDIELDDVLCTIGRLLCSNLATEEIYDVIMEEARIGRHTDRQKQAFIDAMDDWGKVLPLPILNGNSVKGLRAKIAAQPKVRKVGRNEPCPCGSGKKYKHCCGRK